MYLYSGKIVYPHQLLGSPNKAIILGDAFPTQNKNENVLHETSPVKPFKLIATSDQDAIMQLTRYIDAIDPSKRDIIGFEVLPMLRHDYKYEQSMEG